MLPLDGELVEEKGIPGAGEMVELIEGLSRGSDIPELVLSWVQREF